MYYINNSQIVKEKRLVLDGCSLLQVEVLGCQAKIISIQEISKWGIMRPLRTELDQDNITILYDVILTLNLRISKVLCLSKPFAFYEIIIA